MQSVHATALLRQSRNYHVTTSILVGKTYTLGMKLLLLYNETEPSTQSTCHSSVMSSRLQNINTVLSTLRTSYFFFSIFSSAIVHFIFISLCTERTGQKRHGKLRHRINDVVGDTTHISVYHLHIRLHTFLFVNRMTRNK